VTKTALPVKRTRERGRPQYSEDVRDHPILFLRTGLSRYAAAGAAGIHPSTLYEWIEKDPAYRARVEEAEAFGAATYEQNLSELKRNPMPPAIRMRATEFWLSRRRPMDWRERSQIEITLPPEAEVARGPMPDDELDARLLALGEELLRRGRGRDRGTVPGGPADPPSTE
jgi:hypothetical protein